MMHLIAALEALRDARGEEIVVTTMGVTREWIKLSDHPLDFDYIPSAMAHGPGIALGLALAQPQRHVILLNGDGCTLMNLGGLVTTAAAGATNLTLVVMNNGVYEVTGGQQVPASGQVDFPTLASATGFKSALSIESLNDWKTALPKLATLPGPRLVDLHLEPLLGQDPPKFKQSMKDRIARLQQELGVA